MLSPSHRLPASEIPRVMRRGVRIVGKNLQILVHKSEQDVSRFAFIVSTKVDKRATVRNRVRRLMSESVRLSMNQIKPGYDCVIIAGRSLIGLNQADVSKIVIELLKKASLLE
jgi:ribonuclease P protein component